MNTQLHPSITELDEIPLVQHLASDWHWGEPVLHAFRGPKDCSYYLEVPLQGLAEGDIDVLAVNPSKPHEAMAIQIKRVKVQAASFWTGSPNKLSELGKLVDQTNRDTELGFWRTCACAVVVVDSRDNNNGLPDCLDGLNADLNSTIESCLASLQLHPSAGLLHIELVQPTDCPPLTSGAISCHMRRFAKEKMQPNEVTDWVSRVISTRRPTGRSSGQPTAAAYLQR